MKGLTLWYRLHKTLTSVKTKIIIILGLFSLFMVIVIGAAFYVSELQSADAKVIDIAGRQRMLTQKMTKEAYFFLTLLEVSEEELTKTRSNLAESVLLFDATIKALKNGGTVLGTDGKETLLPESSNEVKIQLEKTYEMWVSFKSSLEIITDQNVDIGSDRFYNAVKDVWENNIQILNESNKAVILLEKESEKKSKMLKTVQLSTLLLTLLCAIIAFISGKKFIINPIHRSIIDITSASSEIASTATEHAQIVSQQVSAVNETTVTMDELKASSLQSVEQAEAAASNAANALELSEKGIAALDQTFQGITQLKDKVSDIARNISNLSEQTGRIAEIANMVTDFARETKMLAMNASVEAVRAGEYGKGFSVVSQEIRTLADESKKSAILINELIESINKATLHTVMSAEEGSKASDRGLQLIMKSKDLFNDAVSSVNNVSTNSMQISMNLEQQTKAVIQVVEAMNSIHDSTKETSAGADLTKKGIEKLNEVAHDLKEMV